MGKRTASAQSSHGPGSAHGQPEGSPATAPAKRARGQPTLAEVLRPRSSGDGSSAASAEATDLSRARRDAKSASVHAEEGRATGAESVGRVGLSSESSTGIGTEHVPEELKKTVLYFEAQEGAWCGMHALNNYAGGPYITRQGCRAARDLVCKKLYGEEAHDFHSDHLHDSTGWLSIDVMNFLGKYILVNQPVELHETKFSEFSKLEYERDMMTFVVN